MRLGVVALVFRCRPADGTLTENSEATGFRWVQESEVSAIRDIHLTGPDGPAPRDAVVAAGSRSKILWLVRLSGYPTGGLCEAEHKPPYEQCRVMRSAGLPGLVRTETRAEHCA